MLKDKVSETEFKVHFNLFNGLWKLDQKYGAVECTDQYWKAVTQDAVTLLETCNNDPFAKEMILSYLDYLEGRRRSTDLQAVS